MDNPKTNVSGKIIKSFSPELKASMALEHIQNKVSLSSLCKKYNISSSHISKIIKQFQTDAKKVFMNENANDPSKSIIEELEATKIALAESQTALSILKKKIFTRSV